MQMQRIKKVKLIINGLCEKEINFNCYTEASKLAMPQRNAWSSLPSLNNGKPDLSSEGDERLLKYLEWNGRRTKIKHLDRPYVYSGYLVVRRLQKNGLMVLQVGD